MIAALVLDAADQTIFQQFTTLQLDGYQGYDKALDIYYLVIAYISTLRNWTNHFAFKLSRFLLYYRLIGVALFELTHLRPLLLIFPNTFEYFFIFYETVNLRWNPLRLSKKFLLGAVAFIWIFIKLPQEYWIHIAQNDTTDMIKEKIFKVPIDTPWSVIMQDNPWVVPAVVVAVVVVVGAVWWVLKKLPEADWKWSFDADAHLTKEEKKVKEGLMTKISKEWLDRALVEKVVMVSLVSVIFAQMLPNMRASNMELAVGVTFVIVLNTFLSHWLAQKGREWVSAMREFAVMAVVNFGLVLLYVFLLPRFDGEINLGNTIFFVLLLTLLVTMFDRYRQVYLARFAEELKG